VIIVQDERWWPDPDHGPWLLRVSFATVEGRVVPVGFEMWAEPPPAPASGWARWLRDMPPGTVGTPVAPLTGEAVRVPLGRLTDEVVASARKARGAWPGLKVAAAGGRRVGRPPLYGQAHFERVAAVYRATPRSPTVAVADAFGVPRTTSRKWVARARRMGLLPSWR
jgi:hypothetical protein